MDQPVVPQPDIRFLTPSTLKSYGFRPFVVDALLVTMLRQWFSDPERIEEPTIRSLLWASDLTSAIVIDVKALWDPKKDQERPALIVKRHGCAKQKLGIGDRAQGGFNDDGSEYYAHLMAGSHSILCVAQEEAIAERLAAEVYRSLGQFSEQVRCYLDLNYFGLQGVGEAEALQEAPESSAVPVTVEYRFLEQFATTYQAPRIKRIAMAFEQS